VYAIGHPGTARWAQNIGTVSNISDDPRMPFIQFDSSIWHGSSGGGLFNKNRELIGIPNLRGQNRTGFAIPIDVIKEHLKELKQGKKTRAGWLNIKGSTIEGLDLSVVQTIVKMGLIRPDIDEGFFVSYVEPNSSAEQAGLRKNDIIMEINGTKVERNPYLNFLIEKTPPGTQVPIKVMREKTTILLIATIEEYPGQTQTPILPIPEEIPKQ
jgi:S1-C subfamily serine protease